MKGRGAHSLRVIPSSTRREFPRRWDLWLRRETSRKGGGEVELVARGDVTWLKKDWGFEETLFVSGTHIVEEWDSDKEEEVEVERDVEFLCLGVSPDKRWIVAGGGDGKVYIKDMSKEKVKDGKSNAGKAKDGEGEDNKAKEDGDVETVEIYDDDDDDADVSDEQEEEEGKRVLSLMFGQDEGVSREGGNVVYVGAESGKVCDVDLSRGEVVRTFTGHTRIVCMGWP